ncbi:hypothetical protein Phou_043030 [Phytohabitans houttuyneae]|uniref:Glycosyl transferase family 51 domain-containing protein n=1 Tax=Phytohabitans houttuyneae TaxID=1076126 RepID=A0A6V8K4K9_9ACTN|nr:hypothetical protein Phou_043030 [Phytohabitans houttuyneae]
MRKRDHNIFANAASLLICGLLAGVVVAAAAFPAVAMSGLAAKAGAETFDRLPSELTVKRSPQMTYVYASDGKTTLATLYDENRRDVPLKDVSPIMQQAIIAAEDHTFRTHNGVDAKGIARAFVANNSAGSTTQGASTLTMQLVRMLIAYSATHPQDVVAATEDTNARKLREMKYALQLDKEMTKDEILERYLNIAPFGRGAYGVFAASQVYFGKHPRDLKVEEAALLAGMVKAPSAFDPTTRPASRRRSTAATTSSTTWSRRRRSRPSRPPPRRLSRSRSRTSARPTAASPPAKTTGASSATSSTAGGLSRRRSARPPTTGSGGSRVAATAS